MTEENKKVGFIKTLRNSIGVRVVLISFLVLLLNIPLSMVSGVISSRNYLFNSTMNEISSDWGGSQTIIAPIITLPFTYTHSEKVYNSKTKTYEKVTNTREDYFRYLPENLEINAEIIPQIRHRGIFDVLVHTTKVKITGNFEEIDFSDLSSNYKLLWDKAVISIGINPALIRNDIRIIVDNKAIDVTPGSGIDGIGGIKGDVKFSDKSLNKNFEIELQFNGSSSINFAPLGKRNIFNVESTWAHPKFSGTFRPDNPQISDDGFKANWNIPYIARDYTQYNPTNNDIYRIKSEMASVDLYETMTPYKKAKRLTDYGIMFITLTFILMFLIERRLKKNMHLIQYAIVGFAVSLFFLTTMSLSEYIAFGLAYLIAATIVILMISMYIYAALKSLRTTTISAILMGMLYATLYIMLSEADYAMLIGTIILLITIAAIMWETRNINKTND